MPYLLLFVCLGTWAYRVLRDRPFVHYASLFFVCVLLAVPAEFSTLRLLNTYEWQMKLLADREADIMLVSIIVAWLNPLMGLLYAHYCHRRPVLTAFLAATALGFAEILLNRTGYIVYRSWSPLFTTGLYFGYFLMVWRITLVTTKIPLWVHLYGFILWIALLTDIPLQGIWWSWHFNVTLFGEVVRDNRIVSLLSNVGLLLPCVLLVSLTKGRQWVPLALGAIAFLLLIEALALRSGWLVYNHWSLGWSALKYAAMIAMSVVYTRWVRSAV